MHYAIGVDVGGTSIKAGLVGTDAHIYHQFSTPTPQGPDELVTTIVGIVAQMEDALHAGIPTPMLPDGSEPSIDPSRVVPTVGIDIPGIVNDLTGIGEFSANLGWRDFPARERFAAALNRPVAFGHDVRNGALAESHWGVRLPHFFYIAIGTGIASVLIINQESQSSHPWAGEIGQVPVPDPDNPGTILPMERVSSASAIARRAHEEGLIGEAGGAYHVYRVADGTMSVSEAGGRTPLSAQDAQAQAQRIIDTAMTTLAQTIAPALAGFGPIPVVIGGGLVNEGQALLDHLHAELTKVMGIIPVPTVHAATLGSSSQVLGAAIRAFLTQGVDVPAPPRAKET